MIFLFVTLSLKLHAAELDFSTVRARVVKEMPLLLEAESKIAAAEANLQSQLGAFDHKLKFASNNQVNQASANRFWEFKVERMLPWVGTTLYAGRRQAAGTYGTWNGKSYTSAVGEAFAGFEIPLLRNRTMDEFRLNREISNLQTEQSRFERDQKVLEVLAKSGEAYWKWVASGQKYRVIKAWREISEERQGWMEKKLKEGDISAIKLEDNRRSLAKRHSEEARAQREFEIAQNWLALYLPGEDLSLERVSARIIPSTAPRPQSQEQQRDQLPMFRLLSNEAGQLKQELRLAESLRAPDLRLGVEGAHDLGGPPPGRPQADQLRVGVRFELPIENRKAEGKGQQVRSKLTALGQRRQWLEREWETRMKQNEISLSTLDEQLRWQDTEVAKSEVMAKAESQKLLHGASDVFFVNIREQDLAEVRLKLIETQALREMTLIERRMLDGSLVRN